MLISQYIHIQYTLQCFLETISLGWIHHRWSTKLETPLHRRPAWTSYCHWIPQSFYRNPPTKFSMKISRFSSETPDFYCGPQIFIGDPQIFFEDPKLFIGDPRFLLETPRFLLKTPRFYIYKDPNITNKYPNISNKYPNLTNKYPNISNKYPNISNKYPKELSFCHKLWFSNSYNFATRFPRPLIFQTINSVRSNSLSLKNERLTSSDCKDIEVRKC